MGREPAGVDRDAAERLVARLRQIVDEGQVPSGQLALARNGRVVVSAAAGEATCGGRRAAVSEHTLYAAYSTTKAVTASAAWILFQEGKLSPEDRVADRVPEFAANGKGEVRIWHLLTHTAGFPDAPFDPLEWDDRDRRLARFASWRLDWEPGSRFQYHGASSLWLVAELIGRASGSDYRDFIRRRIAEPLRLPDLFVGLPPEHAGRVADVEVVGEAPDAAATRAAGLTIPEQFGADSEQLLHINDARTRQAGSPGGGGLMTAESLALFYQALLRGGGGDGAPVWDESMLREALRVRTRGLTDPMTGQAPERGLGLVRAGDESRVFRSFAPENSPRAFGHAGAGGQVAWADPASGLSFVFFTNGLDRNPLALGARGIALSSLATACA